jgi:hypothetical protein
MKKINTSSIAAGVAYPPSKKGFDFLQASYQQILGAIAQSVGGYPSTGTEAYVLFGCIKTSLGAGNYQYSEGYIYDGTTKEVYYFPAVASIHIATADVLTITTTADATADPTTFTDGSVHNVHDVRTLVVSDGALNSADINFVDLIFCNVDGEPKIFKRIVNIGNWNMHVSSGGVGSVSVAHGLTFSKIRSVSALILNDAGTDAFNLVRSDFALPPTGGSNYISVGSTNVVLWIETGGAFDGIGFDSSPYNRGYITLEYVL